MKPVYYRQSRTTSSEQYQVMDGDNRIAHLDLHYGSSEVSGTLVLDRELSEGEIEDLIERIDEDLVLSADVPRDDFVIRVYVGREIQLYSQELLRDEFTGNGHEELEDG